MPEDQANKTKTAKRGVSRRRFMTDMAKTACSVGLVGLGIGVYSRQANSLPATAIRPPGALNEKDFLASCTRCGLCVQDCPYGILKLAELGEDITTGTPYFTARTGPCEMCEDIPCIPACPTGALDRNLTDIYKSRMGMAVLVDQEECIAFKGLRCEVCFMICPLAGKAIKLEYNPNQRTGMHAIFIPIVDSKYCTGCGLCEKACIMEEAAIKILPMRLAKGLRGKHYRLGWEEKEKAGKSLVTPDPEHKYTLPEHLRYEHSGKGLYSKSQVAPGAPAMVTPGGGVEDTPFAKNPLETLMKGIEEAK